MHEVTTPLILALASYTNVHPHLARLTVLLLDEHISCVPMTLIADVHAGLSCLG